MIGRQTKLTPELTETLCEHLRKGCYREIACKACGLGKTAFYRWMNEEESPDELHQAFRDAIRAAEAEAELKILKEIDEYVTDGELNDAKMDKMLKYLGIRYSAEGRWSNSNKLDLTSGGEPVKLVISQDFIPGESKPE